MGIGWNSAWQVFKPGFKIWLIRLPETDTDMPIEKLSNPSLSYNPGTRKYPRDAEFRFSVVGNDSDCTTGWAGTPDTHGFTVYFTYLSNWLEKVLTRTYGIIWVIYG